jgi:hypothetical protein
MTRPTSDVVFSPRVKAEQVKRGSRAIYRRVEERGGFALEVDENLFEFLKDQRSFFFATANLEGQPYVQHRGGPSGFVKILGPRRLAFSDFEGNRQYISIGNLRDNPRCQLFFVDYEHRRRVKIWGKARVVEDDPLLSRAVSPEGDSGLVTRVIDVEILAWDVNCPSHIPQLLPAEEVFEVLRTRDAYIEELEKRLGIEPESGR